MRNIIFWINLILGIILILISIFIGISIVMIFLGNTSVFGINPELIRLFFSGNDGASSMAPIFFGLISLSGALLLNSCSHSTKQKSKSN